MGPPCARPRRRYALAARDEAAAAGVACALPARLRPRWSSPAVGCRPARVAGAAADAACARSAPAPASCAPLALREADEDAVAYAAVTDAAGEAERAAALERASEPPLAIAEAAAEVAVAAAEIAAAGTWPFTPDAIAACELAAAAARGAAGLVAANLSGSPDDPRAERARDAAARAVAARDRLAPRG